MIVEPEINEEMLGQVHQYFLAGENATGIAQQEYPEGNCCFGLQDNRPGEDGDVSRDGVHTPEEVPACHKDETDNLQILDYLSGKETAFAQSAIHSLTALLGLE